MVLLSRANAAVNSLARTLAVLGLVALLILAAMTMVDGMMRWLFNKPIEGVRDIGALAIAFAISCCMPIALVERSHISIQVLKVVGGARLSRGLSVLSDLVVLMILVAMAWQFWLYASNLGYETTAILRIPIAPFWFAVDGILWCTVVVQAVAAAVEMTPIRHIAD